MKIKNLIGKLVRYWTLDSKNATCEYGILEDISKEGYLIKDDGASDGRHFIPRERMEQIYYYKDDSEEE